MVIGGTRTLVEIARRGLYNLEGHLNVPHYLLPQPRSSFHA